MTAPQPPTDADDQPNEKQPAEQVRKDNKTIDWMIWLWTILAPVAFVIIWAVS